MLRDHQQGTSAPHARHVAGPASAGLEHPARILIIEDELLIALMIEEMARKIGYRVLGVAHTMAMAGREFGKRNYDVVLLDINIGGRYHAATADHLLGWGVPFAFVTGYDYLVEPRHEGERHAPPQQMIRGRRVVSPAYIDIQENDVVVALPNLPLPWPWCEPHPDHAIANLPRHFFDHEGNKQLVPMMSMRAGVQARQSGSGDMPRVWCRSVMIAQHNLTGRIRLQFHGNAPTRPGSARLGGERSPGVTFGGQSTDNTAFQYPIIYSEHERAYMAILGAIREVYHLSTRTLRSKMGICAARE